MCHAVGSCELRGLLLIFFMYYSSSVGYSEPSYFKARVLHARHGPAMGSRMVRMRILYSSKIVLTCCPRRDPLTSCGG